jgi:hypothetical protein
MVMLYRRGNTRQNAIRFFWRFFVPVQKYHVAREHGEWTIRFDEERIGGFLSESVAVATAVETAHLQSKRGTETEVLVLRDGVYQCKWRYGRDPYPQTANRPRQTASR